jgi:NACHT domain
MVAETLTAAALSKKALEKLVEDIYEQGKGQFSTILKRWKTKAGVNTFHKKAANVRFVKTLWQFDKPVDLREFYSSTKVKIGDKRGTIRKVINDLADIGSDDNLVLQGTLGQGKSIFLRYLTLAELRKGIALPIFFELRRLQQNSTLLSQLLTEFTSLGLDLDEELFRFLADCGRLVLFLDGFDEVKEEYRASIINELESLAKRHEKLRIVISARPESAIQSSPLFRVFQIAPLQGPEYVDVIRRVAHDDELASELTALIKKEHRRVAQMLTTPLMVTLVVVKFKVDRTIPDNLVGFFSDLFSILLSRHDKTKPGFMRPRKSGVPDVVFEECFNALSFLTRKRQEVAFSREGLTEYARQAIDIVGCKCDPDGLVQDILQITCLIVEDGGNCEYIHKGVQEFHSARFIKKQPEAFAEKFYTRVSDAWYEWAAVLEFLEVVDRYRFVKWFEMPELRAMLGGYRRGRADSTTLSPSEASEILELSRVEFVVVDEAITEWTQRAWWWGRRSSQWFRVIAACREGLVEIRKHLGVQSPVGVRVCDLVKEGVVLGPLMEAVSLSVGEVVERLGELEAYVRHTEEAASLLEV